MGRIRATAGGCAALAILVMLGCGGGTGGTPIPAGPGPVAPPQVQHWVGARPDGMLAVVNALLWCPAEYDLQLDLTTTGTAVTGTAVTKLREVAPGGRCGDVFGQVANYDVVNGTAESGKISFGLAGVLTFSGTFTATRMTGTFTTTATAQTGTFAVNRP